LERAHAGAAPAHKGWRDRPGPKIIVRDGHQGPKEIGVSSYFTDWLYDPVKNGGGGALIDFGCYGAELALWLKGRPLRVFATSRKIKTDQAYTVDDDATILLEYREATAIIEASWTWPYSMGEVEVFGPKGSLLAAYNRLLWRDAQPHKQGIAERSLEMPALSGEESEPIAYFLHCIRNDQPMEDPVSAAMNVGVMQILDAAKESLRTGRAVDLGNLD
jgi:predicted dehydrogenase